MWSEDVFVIAEIGKNFIQTKEDRPVSEYLENAKALVEAAKNAGADAVKFQTHTVSDEQAPLAVVSPHFNAADRYSWVTRNTLATPLEGFWRPLKAFCEKIGVSFFSTPMSRGAAKVLDQVGVPLWKLGSGDVHDYLMLDYVLGTHKPLIISTGMVSFAELSDVVSYIGARAPRLGILYCVSQYPAPKESFNLSTIDRFSRSFPHATIGFSDHSLGNEVALAAVKLGARIVEKHFSFSRSLWGPDHKVSLTPAELADLVRSIRNGDFNLVDETPYLGSMESELEGAVNLFRPYFKKSLVAERDIPTGSAITDEMLVALRPQMLLEGVPSERLNAVVGRRALRAIKAGSVIQLSDLTLEAP